MGSYFIKFSIGVLAVLAWGAFASTGVASASDTILCDVNADNCAGGSQYAADTDFDGALRANTMAELRSFALNVDCEESEATIRNTAAAGDPLPGLVTALSFDECETTGGTPCTVDIVGLSYSGSILATGGGDGTLTVENPTADITCGSTNCEYSSSQVEGSVTGGDPASVAFNAVSLTISGGDFICLFNPSATWTSTYDLHPRNPTEVFVRND